MVVAQVRFLVKPTNFSGLLVQMAAERRFSPTSEETELMYDAFFSGIRTRVHEFVFLSCPIPSAFDQ